MQQLSSADASMLLMELPETPNVIAPILICDQSTVTGGKLGLTQIRAKMRVALDAAPNFRRKMVRLPFDMDDPYWVDDPQFDLDYHIRHMALPQPGDRKQFEIQIARLLSRPLDYSKPLWEMNVIEGLDNIEHLPKGCFAVMIKVHHAMVDGMGMVALLNSMSETEPRPLSEVTKGGSNWQPQPAPSMGELVVRGLLRSMTRPTKVAAKIAGQVGNAIKKREEVERPPETSNRIPKAPYNGLIGVARVYASNWYTLAEFRALRQLVPGSTVNDVSLAVIAGAQRRYLQSKSALPADSIKAMVPISLRSSKQAEAGGNDIAMMVAPLPTEVPDAVERMRRIVAATAYLKKDDRALSPRAMMDVTSAMLGRSMGTLARAMARLGSAAGRAFGANTLVTNVPGSPVPLYFLGARIINQLGVGPCMGNIGLIHLVGTYCEWLNLNVVGARELVPDIDFYMTCLDESLAEYRALLAATGVKPPPEVPAPGRGEPRSAGKRTRTRRADAAAT